MSSAMKTTPAVKRLSRYSCIFRGAFVREQVDPRVKELWQSTTGKPAPFGRLRMNFQQEHCRAVNPYGSEDCPFREEECAMAFLATVQNVLLPWITDPAAYFVKVARSTGIERADNKPLARERHREEGSSHPGYAIRRHRAGHDGVVSSAPGSPVASPDRMRRPDRRPQSVGSLLGAYDFGARQGLPEDGPEGTK